MLKSSRNVNFVNGDFPLRSRGTVRGRRCNFRAEERRAPRSGLRACYDLQALPCPNYLLVSHRESGFSARSFFCFSVQRHLRATIPPAGIPGESGSSAPPRLEKELIWQQGERILDAIFLRGETGANDRLVVLQQDLLSVFEKRAEGWKIVQSKPLGETAITRRAPHGELYFSQDQPDRVKIVLPGKTCQTKFSDATALSCQQNLDVWRSGELLRSPCDTQAWWLRSDGGDMTMPDRLELVNPALPATQEPVAGLTTNGP